MQTASIKGRICYKDSCHTCGDNRGFVRKQDIGKNCKSCSNTINKTGTISPKRGIKTGLPAWNRNNMSRRLRHCVNKQNVHVFALVGYSVSDLVKHLESKFQPGMSWGNYGRKSNIDCWEIDHLIPETWFKYSSFEDNEFKKCWSLSNLQPKWAFENKSKGNRFSEEDLCQKL